MIRPPLPALVVCALALAACPGPSPGPGGDDKPKPDEPAWRLRPVEGVELPERRWGHIPAYTANSTYFFGGADIELSDGSGLVLSDSWRVDVEGDTPAFVRLGGDADAVPRYCGCAAVNADDDEVLVMGGRDQENMVIVDAWIFSLADETWTEVEGELPDGMVGCGAVFIPGTHSAYVFGGGASAFASSATLKFDAATRTFTRLDIEGPSARFDHQLRASTDFSHLWLVAGARTAFTDFSSDVWRFDVASETWTELATTGGPPPGRRTPWLALRDDDSALVMGFGVAGVGPESDLGDLWHLDLTSGEWTELDVGDMLPPRAFSYFLRAPAGGVGLVYAGTDMEHTLDDLWVLEGPDPDAGWH